MLKSWKDSAEHTFFATTPPGLEHICLQELDPFKEQLAELKTLHGGIEFEAPSELMPLIIRSLKTPTHLLWRLGSFRVRDFPKLYSKARAMPWAKLITSPEIEMKVSSTSSRLIHTKRLEKTLRDAIATSLAAHAPKKELILKYQAHPPESLPTLYARLDNDVLTLSLDLAGENLHRRSGKKNKRVGSAPLRENLAYACLATATNDLHKRSQGSDELTLWDPFCGSGTLLSEAIDWRAPSERRDYALDLFEDYIKTKTEAPRPLFSKFIGTDLDSKMIEATNENCSHLSALHSLTLTCVDISLAPEPKEPFVIVTNPPYGERIKNIAGLASLYERARDFEKCLGVYVLIPHHLAPKGANLILKFSHGGLSVGIYLL